MTIVEHSDLLPSNTEAKIVFWLLLFEFCKPSKFVRIYLHNPVIRVKLDTKSNFTPDHDGVVDDMIKKADRWYGD